MKRIPHPSPAMIVAIIALVIAVGGTATALPGKFTVGRKDLKNESVGARALGRTVQVNSVIWSKDELANDGVFREAEGKIRCPARAPFAFDPYIIGLGPDAFETHRSTILNRWRSPGGYWFRIATDGGDAGYSLRVSCLPRR